MARDKTIPFIHLINNACATGDAMAVIEGMRIFGYVNEIEYSKLTTAWTQITQGVLVRSDGAETIELARMPKDPEDVLPKEF